jgi:uncharacterized repeat protein (TIGR03803 family)
VRHAKPDDLILSSGVLDWGYSVKSKKLFLPNPSTTMIVGLAVLMVASVLAPGAWAASKYKTLYRFTGGTDGNRPEAGLILDRAGNLYGTTETGGANDCDGHGCGTVFRLTPHKGGTWTEEVLYSFGFEDAWDPEYASLIFDASENLYGVTSEGGVYRSGTVFMLSNGSWSETILHSFDFSNDGSDPAGALIFDQAGNLYGTTYQGPGCNEGCGIVFELTPGGGGNWTETVLHSFGPNGNDGLFPVAGLVLDATEKLYGTTQEGGTYGQGTVYQLTPKQDGAWAEHVIHSFNGADGSQPWAGSLILDGAGNLYGTTLLGGRYSSGTVFELTPNADGSWKESVLHSFQRNGKDGAEPFSALIFDNAGNLFGTTAGGGTSGYGTVFELSPRTNGSWKETVLHSFRDRPGAQPYGGLIFDEQGNLYGTTSGDDSATFGSVFEIAP